MAVTLSSARMLTAGVADINSDIIIEYFGYDGNTGKAYIFFMVFIYYE
ncbi:MAG: hypothetical protein R2942_18780 [Ignavibacteria bacterium]